MRNILAIMMITFVFAAACAKQGPGKPTPEKPVAPDKEPEAVKAAPVPEAAPPAVVVEEVT